MRTVLAFLSALCFALAFIFHWGDYGRVPFDVTGFALLGLLFLALLALFADWQPWVRRLPGSPGAR